MLAVVTEPQVFIECEKCREEGRETGKWFPATTAGAVRPKDLHEGREHCCAELWCSKTQGLIHDYECDPQEAQKQAELLHGLEPELHEALRAWTRTGMAAEDPDGLPDVEVFRDLYLGEFFDFKEFADWYAANTGLLDGTPVEITKYFDWDLYANDLRHDFVTEATDNGEAIHVFSTY